MRRSVELNAPPLKMRNSAALTLKLNFNKTRSDLLRSLTTIFAILEVLLPGQKVIWFDSFTLIMQSPASNQSSVSL